MLFEANITQSADLISIQSQAETYITKHPAIINTVSLEYLEQLKNINKAQASSCIIVDDPWFGRNLLDLAEKLPDMNSQDDDTFEEGYAYNVDGGAPYDPNNKTGDPTPFMTIGVKGKTVLCMITAPINQNSETNLQATQLHLESATEDDIQAETQMFQPAQPVENNDAVSIPNSNKLYHIGIGLACITTILTALRILSNLRSRNKKLLSDQFNNSNNRNEGDQDYSTNQKVGRRLKPGLLTALGNIKTHNINYQMQSRELRDGEKINPAFYLVNGQCMKDALKGEFFISEPNAVYTQNPQSGDVGVVIVHEENGQTFGRLGIFGGINKKTGKGIILTSNRGFGHSRHEEIDMSVKNGSHVGEMKVVGRIDSTTLRELKLNIKYAKSGDNDPL
ncbi:hypothetical protein A2767_01985 [Candidatus Roizmanbacteria bacterium RIFCSPHIGHO2_01_FULL_35_10]|uniref:Uncharacterized protein n=1 Tax=Candidatus Roizmanbacteria bacterium RIFCSPLOWO2_01_FULL_35_13 TaxID=1802055 RepID=A0A1F7I796_9BACT|nr:MAG: hypothetical protein A2767_01985 [Candidatus Roizmanbacteria bacterium RIFCSPHIGHO2_01_FULL_35_10]OGK39231.1 MAG: hypothetical protein A3A74_07400 [Candidatus Roizmanbacteria bacterium RIFCSPLOWO2_01_FULL_35_13]